MARPIFVFCLLTAIAAAQAPQPLTAEQAVDEAVANNLELTAQKLSVTVAQAAEITARLRPNPVLTVSGQTLNVLGATYSPDTPLGPNQFNLHTDFPVERGHKRQERIALAREDTSLAQLGVRELMRQLIAAVQAGYVEVQQAKENLNLARENLKSLDGVVAVNEARVRSGDLAVVELDRSRVAALQYAAAVRQAELALAQAKTRLQQLMGRAARSQEFDVAGDMRRQDSLPTPEEILRLALLRRPDYLASQQTQTRSRADLRLQLANGKFDYSLGTEYTHQSAWGASGSSMGFYFSMPLPVFNRNQGEIARAQREINLTGARIRSVEASIASEIEQAHRQCTVSRLLLTGIEQDMLGKARSVRDITEYSYRRGEATLVEFLDAQRAFNDASMAFNEARASYAKSLYQIDAVSGATVAGK
ncbi:MAG: TolC family protein [Acidobacteria bacterium]|nr:TolC family protein [Acidobacteriota bacterium]